MTDTDLEFQKRRVRDLQLAARRAFEAYDYAAWELVRLAAALAPAKCCQGLDPECRNEADCDARTGRSTR